MGRKNDEIPFSLPSGCWYNLSTLSSVPELVFLKKYAKKEKRKKAPALFFFFEIRLVFPTSCKMSKTVIMTSDFGGKADGKGQALTLQLLMNWRIS